MKRNLIPAKTLACAAFVLALSGPALMAQFTININDSSFETALATIPYSTTISTQWRETFINGNSAGELLGTSAMFDTVPVVPDGSYCLWINNNFSSPQSVFQGLSDNLSAGDYTFTVWIGERKDLGGGWAPSVGQFSLLAANGANLSSATVITPTSSTSPSLSAGQWAQFTKSYTIAPGNPLIGHQLVVEFTNPTLGNYESTFDKVQLTSSVPEPATAATFLLGGAALVFALRRRR